MGRATVDQLRLVTSTMARNLSDDPLSFVLLVGRRFLGRRRSALVGSGDGLLAALGAYLGDRPEVCAEILRGRCPADGPFERLAARLALAVGVPEAVPEALRTDPRIQSDEAWMRGDLTRAVALLEGSSSLAARRRRSELTLLQPGYRLQVDIGPGRGRGDGSRVLHVLTNSLPYTRSGYTARSHAVLKAQRAAGLTVSASTRLGYPVTVGRFGVASMDVVDGVAYHRMLVPSLPVDAGRRLEAQVSALDHLVESFAPGVLHTTTDFTNALVTEGLARRHGLPWVYEMRGQLELSWVAGLPAGLRDIGAASEKVSLLRAKEAELAGAANAVVVLSQVQADDLAARGVPAERISVVPNSIDPALLTRTTTPSEARASLGLPGEGVWAGTVSSLVDYEGLDTFLRAMASVRRSGIDIRGAVVGDGVSRPALMGLAEDLGISGAVAFPGRVSPVDAIRWCEALDVVVLPRRDTPVCRMVTPLKPVEAMALARPLVASDLPALREVVGEGGLLVAADDVDEWERALVRLMGDDVLRRELGRAGRSAAVERTWQAGAVTYADIYRSLAPDV